MPDEQVIQLIRRGVITKEDLERLKNAKIEDIYNSHVLSASEDLGVHIDPTYRIDRLLKVA